MPPGENPVSKLSRLRRRGHVSLGTIGKDGKPGAPRLQGQARAARKGSLAAIVVPSIGVIAEIPPDAVNVGIASSRWKKLMAN